MTTSRQAKHCVVGSRLWVGDMSASVHIYIDTCTVRTYTASLDLSFVLLDRVGRNDRNGGLDRAGPNQRTVPGWTESMDRTGRG